jgi:hypothetical protein
VDGDVSQRSLLDQAVLLAQRGLDPADDHVTHCVAGALASGDEAEATTKTTELLDAVRRFARTR